MQNKTQPIVTRFAPSPTGYLHIGGARTALFNWLLARSLGGKFLLRIEDTDRERSTEAATLAILDGLKWLGLDWDGEPVSQNANAPRHTAVVDELLATGHAFRCYMSDEESAVVRETAFSEGRALRSTWRDRPASDAPHDSKFVVRFRAGDDDVVVQDAVQGDVRWNGKEFDDLVLLRSDGTPTYNLAVVVDDHDMGVTHIVRGDDHLVNAGRQSQIYDALGWERPVFAHVPLIHGSDGKKLSKRHGALGIEAYRELGYLPEGLRNYLLRLGWAQGDQEYFSDDEAKAAFNLNGLNKAPGRLDFDKMASVNGHYMKLADNNRLLELASPWCEKLVQGLDTNRKSFQRPVLAAMDVLKTRASTLADLADQTYFLIQPTPIVLEGKAAKPMKGDAPSLLSRFMPRLEGISIWTSEILHGELEAFVETEGIGFGKLGSPLRAALTGGAPAPDLSLVMEWLGQDEVLRRIADQIKTGT